MTRTNAPMNNRVILFREPIRLSARRAKVRGCARRLIRAGRERARDRARRAEEKRIERQDGKRKETTAKRREPPHRFSRNNYVDRVAPRFGFSPLQDLRQDAYGGNLGTLSRSVDAGICDQLMPNLPLILPTGGLMRSRAAPQLDRFHGAIFRLKSSKSSIFTRLRRTARNRS